MRVPIGIQATALDGTELVRVVQGGKFVLTTVAAIIAGSSLQSALASALTPILARLGAAEQALAANTAHDNAQDTALTQEQQLRTAADAAEVIARQAISAALGQEATTRQAADQAFTTALSAEAQARQAADQAEAQTRANADTAETSARSSTDTAQAARLAGLEGKAEEVVHFTGTTTLPGISLLGTTSHVFTVTPAKAGDVLAIGEQISVEPSGALPGGISFSSARVKAANTITLQLTSTVAIPAGAAVTWNVSALR